MTTSTTTNDNKRQKTSDATTFDLIGDVIARKGYANVFGVVSEPLRAPTTTRTGGSRLLFDSRHNSDSVSLICNVC